MTGNKVNKNLKSKIYDLGSNSGQTLLIIIMLLATALTVALSVSFKSTTETQVTKLEEESQKALAAAEAGIEAALTRKTTVNIDSTLSTDLGGFTGQASISPNQPSEFISPLLQKDEQYTFYLSNYPGFSSNTFNGILVVYYGSQVGSVCNNIPLELTLIYDNTNKIKKWIADSGDKFGTEGESDDIYSEVKMVNTFDNGPTFECNTISIDLRDTTGRYPNPKILIVRNFSSSSTQIGFRGDDGLGSLINLNFQGTTVNSEAKSTGTGVTKKVRLFQSYPQIPAEFFVTSF